MASAAKGHPWIEALLRRRWALAVAGGLAVAGLLGQEGFRLLVGNYFELRALRGEIERLESQREGLERRLRLIENSDPYLETVARRDLGMIRPDETEYRFPAPGRR